MRATLPAFVAILGLATSAGTAMLPPLPMPNMMRIKGGDFSLKGISIVASVPAETVAVRRLAELVACSEIARLAIGQARR